MNPHAKYLEELGPYEDYVRKQAGLLERALDLAPQVSKSRISTLATLVAQICSFSRSMVLMARSGGVSEAYLLARSILDASTNLCYLLVCDEEDFERFVDFSKRNILRALETRAKALEAIGDSVEIPFMRNAEPFKGLFQKFTSPKKGKDLTRWETEKAASLEKKLEKVSMKVSGFNAREFEAARLFIYEDASEIAHGTLYGSALCTGIFYGTDSFESAATYALGIIRVLYLVIGSLLDSVLLVIGETYDIKGLIKESKNNFEALGSTFHTNSQRRKIKT